MIACHYLSAAVIAFLLMMSACSTPEEPVRVSVRDVAVESDAMLIGVGSAGPVVWVSGTSGTYGRSVDYGWSWTFGKVAGADSLQFRDVHVVDSSRAYLLSIGPGTQSRVYHTANGGRLWSLQWTNQVPEGFFDCFDFWSATEGIAMGDAVGGRIMMIRTFDGVHWSAVDSLAIPRGAAGEGGFAASGTCLVTQGDSTAWVATGSADVAKIYRSTDRGNTWDVVATPVVSGYEASGIMSLTFLDEKVGFAAGGALSRPDESHPNFAATSDGGRTWTLRARPQLPNVYGITARAREAGVVILAVGPKGLDVSADAGHSWRSVDKRNYWGVRFVDDSTAVAVGPNGRISRLTVIADR